MQRTDIDEDLDRRFRDSAEGPAAVNGRRESDKDGRLPGGRDRRDRDWREAGESWRGRPRGRFVSSLDELRQRHDDIDQRFNDTGTPDSTSHKRPASTRHESPVAGNPPTNHHQGSQGGALGATDGRRSAAEAVDRAVLRAALADQDAIIAQLRDELADLHKQPPRENGSAPAVVEAPTGEEAPGCPATTKSDGESKVASAAPAELQARIADLEKAVAERDQRLTTLRESHNMSVSELYVRRCDTQGKASRLRAVPLPVACASQEEEQNKAHCATLGEADAPHLLENRLQGAAVRARRPQGEDAQGGYSGPRREATSAVSYRERRPGPPAGDDDAGTCAPRWCWSLAGARRRSGGSNGQVVAQLRSHVIRAVAAGALAGPSEHSQH